MGDTENLKAILLPYLKLNDSEEILYINKFTEKKILPIRSLAKYHDPNTLPEEIFKKKGKNYVYHDIEILTNQRIGFFCLNLHYLKEDGVTPISDIFQIENYVVWINHEDIKQFDIEFGEGAWKGITIAFWFYAAEGGKSREMPLRMHCSDYFSYSETKNALINTPGYNSSKIKNQEQQCMNSIRSLNRWYFFTGITFLAIIGVILIFNETPHFPSYTTVWLYIIYAGFFILYNLYWIRDLSRRNDDSFLDLAKNDFTWYKGPWITFTFAGICISIFIIDYILSFIISDNFLSFLASIGIIGFILCFSVGIGMVYEKMS